MARIQQGISGVETARMEIKAYCRKMDAELTAWKVKLYEVISRMDQLPAGSRETIYQHVNTVLALMAEIDARIETLQSQCPREWRGRDAEINNKITELGKRYLKTEKVFACHCAEIPQQ